MYLTQDGSRGSQKPPFTKWPHHETCTSKEYSPPEVDLSGTYRDWKRNDLQYNLKEFELLQLQREGRARRALLQGVSIRNKVTTVSLSLTFRARRGGTETILGFSWPSTSGESCASCHPSPGEIEPERRGEGGVAAVPER